MRPAIIYRRVSTTRQDEEGKSLEDQDAELIDYCRAMKFEVIGNFQDAISGRREKIHKRKGLEKALQLACQEKATLVVYDLDRLARSQSAGMQIVERLKDCGAKLVVKSLGIDTNTPAGEMIVGVMFAVAQWGSRAIAEGVKRANRQTVKTKGYRTQGEQPFGYKIVDGKRVEVPEEQAILKKVRQYYKTGNGTYYATAKKLNEEGVPIPSMVRFGQPGNWTPSTVKRLVGKKSTDRQR